MVVLCRAFTLAHHFSVSDNVETASMSLQDEVFCWHAVFCDANMFSEFGITVYVRISSY